MLTADSVYTIAKALSKEELVALYARISKELNKDILPKSNKTNSNRLTKAEVDKMLWERVFNVKTIQDYTKNLNDDK